MTSEAAEKAKKMMAEQRGHCAQAVFTSLGEQASSGEIDFDMMMKVASAFSGGIARMGNVCGAVTGALMALGLKYGGPNSTKVNEVAKELLDEFTSLHGSIICRELIETDLITDEDVQKAFKTGAFDNCPKFVEGATLLLEKLL
ncbi:MAG: C-GCAxxG-C-C family protein [Candidatus Thorarchaeota archaeon]